jgi:cyclopropane-fatty-acyl-phospholipid synthase
MSNTLSNDHSLEQALGMPITLPPDAPAAARAGLKLMQRLKHGRLTIRTPDGQTFGFGSGQPAHLRASLELRNWAIAKAALKSGDIGFAETYIAGDWATPSLVDVLRVFIANRNEVEAVIYGTWWGRLLYRIKHLLNRNSRAGSEKNIHAHYDLGNEFYKLWLDDTMSYSSALFAGNLEQTMETAQVAKVRRAVSLSGVQPGERLLEIGCGWGTLAEVAAREFGAQVTGITLSKEQLAWGQHKLSEQGLSDRATLRFQDYRDVADGPYDAIVSIEMFEAVGREYWDTWFATVARNLKPGGRACVQTITIADELFDRYAKSTDFIQQYIFPGGMLPSPTAFRAQAAKAGLEVVDEFAFGRDYAETLKRWREDFLREELKVRPLGFDERFMRIWEFYLAYCEAAFEAGNTDVVQYTLRKR